MKQIFNGTQFVNCEEQYWGGVIYTSIQSENSILELIGVVFENCTSLDTGGGIYASIYSGAQFVMSGTCLFKNCSSVLSGGGIYTDIGKGGQLGIKDQCFFTECKSISGSGGGIYSNINDATLNIEDTTFDRCTCSQPGNGGGITLYQGSSSIISITNSSFKDCKTISNSPDQRYGWGGGIFIQTSVTAENLNESNFIIRDLIFSRCSAVNSIGNNLHIQSIDTYATGEAIEVGNLLSVNETIDLYYNNNYQYDYMGIDQSKVGNGTTIINNIPLFQANQTVDRILNLAQ
ncbi:MAG: hypothetical protein EZS28_021310 [Streblomastix strix]|uniref:Right handed beta helix domain-containing protein n=1 Tax=Streblomastix strix TaxID=222440 RepID=A0A5J4VKY7_9EUKA|nr:MAG: hypothetical protein EZS28_021310 [Streblomastix strix]